MKKTHLKGATVATAIMSLAFVVPVFAETNTPPQRPIMSARINAENRMMGSTTRPAGMLSSTTRMMDREQNREQKRASTTEARMQKGMDRGENMIDQRIDSLKKLLVRIQGMKHVSDSDKALLSTSINAEIAALTDLKSKITSDTSTTSLKADVNSITKSYRIYALVEPQAQIIAAADRVLGIVDSLTIIGNKVNTRIASSTLASSTPANLSDFTAQLATATTQAKAAIALISGLKPDNGDATIAAANKKALQDARADVVSAQKALQAAEKIIRTAVGNLGHVKNNIDAVRGGPKLRMNATSTATTTP